MGQGSGVRKWVVEIEADWNSAWATIRNDDGAENTLIRTAQECAPEDTPLATVLRWVDWALPHVARCGKCGQYPCCCRDDELWI